MIIQDRGSTLGLASQSEFWIFLSFIILFNNKKKKGARGPGTQIGTSQPERLLVAKTVFSTVIWYTYFLLAVMLKSLL